MKIKKELIDQSLHFAAGFILTYALSFFIPVIASAAAVMCGAILREKLQHTTKKFWQLGKGSMIDLLFWAIGVGLAVGLVLSKII